MFMMILHFWNFITIVLYITLSAPCLMDVVCYGRIFIVLYVILLNLGLIMLCLLIIVFHKLHLNMRYFTRRFKTHDRAWSYYCMLFQHGRVHSFQRCDTLFDPNESSFLCFDIKGRQVCELIFYNN